MLYIPSLSFCRFYPLYLGCWIYWHKITHHIHIYNIHIYNIHIYMCIYILFCMYACVWLKFGLGLLPGLAWDCTPLGSTCILVGTTDTCHHTHLVSVTNFCPDWPQTVIFLFPPPKYPNDQPGGICSQSHQPLHCLHF
jgi:hypothetical protein